MENKSNTNPENSPLYLEDIVISLQKTFSRVTQMTEENEGKTAQMIGEVNFEIKTKLNPILDRLQYDKNGTIEIAISGTIDQDINEEENSGTNET